MQQPRLFNLDYMMYFSGETIFCVFLCELLLRVHLIQTNGEINPRL